MESRTGRSGTARRPTPAIASLDRPEHDSLALWFVGQHANPYRGASWLRTDRDVRRHGTDGIAATRQIVAEAPAANVIILTRYGTDQCAFSGLNAGPADSCSRT